MQELGVKKIIMETTLDDRYSIVHTEITNATMGDAIPMKKSATAFQIATTEVMKTITIAVTLLFKLL